MALKRIFHIIGFQALLSVLGYMGFLLAGAQPNNLAGFDPSHNGLSLTVGSCVSGLNFLALSIFYLSVFQKKRVALGITTVVFKYAILGILLWYFLVESKLPEGAFLVGIVLNPVAIIFYALLNSKSLVGGSKDGV